MVTPGQKQGQVIMPGGTGYIGTQIIEGEKQLTPIKKYIAGGSIHFVGREKELSLIHENFQQYNYVSIAGMGGVGKTELATQYMKRYEQEYAGIIPFNARETLLAEEVLSFFSLQLLRLGLNIPQKHRQERPLNLKQQIAWCWSLYKDSGSPILIVFDDVTNLANLQEAIPTENHYRVLITTRVQNLDPNLIQEIPLDVLSPKKEGNKALELLERLLGETDKRINEHPKDAEEICQCLGYLPLGIELVGTYLKKDRELFLSTMLERLQEQKLNEEALQDQQTLNTIQLGVKAALNLTWSRLNPLTQQLGMFLSLFAPGQISWNLVVRATKGKDKAVTNDQEGQQTEESPLNWSEKQLNEARKQLYERNLLQILEETQGYYKIHALVRWFLEEQLAQEREMCPILVRSFATTMIAIAQEIPSSPTSREIEVFKPAIVHLEDLGRRLTAPIRKKQEPIPASSLGDEVIWVFRGINRFYSGQGLYKLAEPWCQECLEICRSLFSGDPASVAGSLNNLALVYASQGRYSEAEPLFTEALEMTRGMFKGNHPDVALSLNNLGLLYYSQGRYSEAEPLYTEALEMYRGIFEEDHPDVATSLNNLAELYRSQGRYSEAEPLYTEALEMYRGMFEEDHPNVAGSLNNLGLLYYSQGRYSEAEPLFTEAL